MSFISSNSWIILSPIEQSIKGKIDTIGVPLKEWKVSINYGIKTGLNDAFIINGERKNELIKLDSKSAEIIRPILRGRDIKRYGYDYADLWLIATFPSRHYDIDNYPAVKKYLLSYGMERLEQTGRKHLVNGVEVKARKKTNNKWFETQDSISYWDDFSKQKIAYAETMRVHKTKSADRFPRFTMVEEGFFHDKTSFIITGDNLPYLLAIMNSSLMYYYISRNIAVLDTGGFLMQKIYVDYFPIPQVTDEIMQQLGSLCNKVIKMRQSKEETSQIEDEIDRIVFNLFELSAEEIAYIRQQISLS